MPAEELASKEEGIGIKKMRQYAITYYSLTAELYLCHPQKTGNEPTFK